MLSVTGHWLIDMNDLLPTRTAAAHAMAGIKEQALTDLAMGGVVPPGASPEGPGGRGMGAGTLVIVISKCAVFQRSYGLGMAIPADLCHIFHLAELQTMGVTGGHASGIQPLVNPIFAIVALDHLAGFRIPLGSPPGAGGNAGFTSHTQAVIHENDAVASALLHGTGGAGSHTPGIFTVKAGHENIRGPGKPADHLRSHLNNLAQPGAYRKILVGLALYFTGMAADAFFGVLKQIVLAHSPLILLNAGTIATTVPLGIAA